jgi:hypothetical protein
MSFYCQNFFQKPTISFQDFCPSLILEARAEILEIFVSFFLEEVFTPKGHFEIN